MCVHVCGHSKLGRLDPHLLDRYARILFLSLSYEYRPAQHSDRTLLRLTLDLSTHTHMCSLSFRVRDQITIECTRALKLIKSKRMEENYQMDDRQDADLLLLLKYEGRSSSSSRREQGRADRETTTSGRIRVLSIERYSNAINLFRKFNGARNELFTPSSISFD